MLEKARSEFQACNQAVGNICSLRELRCSCYAKYRIGSQKLDEVRLFPNAFQQLAGTFHCALQREPYSIVPFGLASPSFYPPIDNSSAGNSFQIPVRKLPQI